MDWGMEIGDWLNGDWVNQLIGGLEIGGWRLVDQLIGGLGTPKTKDPAKKPGLSISTGLISSL